jgi:hypothetical protein
MWITAQKADLLASECDVWPLRALNRMPSTLFLDVEWSFQWHLPSRHELAHRRFNLRLPMSGNLQITACFHEPIHGVAMRTLSDRDHKDLDHIVPSRDLSYVDPPKADYTYRQALRTEPQPMTPQNPLAARDLIRAHRMQYVVVRRFTVLVLTFRSGRLFPFSEPTLDSPPYPV